MWEAAQWQEAMDWLLAPVERINVGGNDLFVYVADSAEAAAQGLMGVTELDVDGMLFAYSAPRHTAFWMKNTPIPLTIYWFDADGFLIGSQDMEPCLNQRFCPTYRAPRPFQYALEIPQDHALVLSDTAMLRRSNAT